MKYKFYCIFFLFISFSVECLASKGWELERSEDGMVAECRLHKSGYKYCKIIAETGHSLKELIAINTDAPNLYRWMETIKYSEQVSRTNDQDYINCVKYDIPYPFNDRESCTRSTIELSDNKMEIKLEFKTVPLVVDTLDHDNMEQIYGYWKFKDLGDKRRVEYATIVLPGGNLVPMLYNLEALNVPWKTVKNMFRELDKGLYKSTNISFLP